MTVRSPSGAGPKVRLGVVASFEAGRGLGSVRELRAAATREEVEGEGPEAAYRFHSTAIADGSRRIERGTAVCFVIVSAHGGELEARELHRLADAAPPSS